MRSVLVSISIVLFFLFPFFISAQDVISDEDRDSLDQLILDLTVKKAPEKAEKKPEAKPESKNGTPKKQTEKPKTGPAGKAKGQSAEPKNGKTRIIIDPGHGGKDPGAVSGKIYEKDIVLKLAKKIEQLSKKYDSVEVKLTRSKDLFLELSERAVIANNMEGDLFISLHTNSFKDRNVGGMEIYHLDNTKDEYSTKLASVENKISEDSSLLNTILVDMSINYYVKDSLDYASEIAARLKDHTKKYKVNLRGYKKGALFYVLVGARMPSLLFEIGYITNKEERLLLQNDAYLESIAKALLDAIANSKVER